MQVDWITVAAQIVNFLILVWLLHRFLYGPITRAMARRENRIKERLDDAAQEREEAKAKQRELDQKLQELEDRRDEKLREAREEAEGVKRKLEQEAREEVDRKREAWLAEMREDQEEFMMHLRETISTSFRDLAEDALRDLADSSLSERMAVVFVGRLHDLPEDDVQRLRESSRENGGVRIETGQPIEADTRRKLTRTVHDLIAEDIEVAFEGDVSGLVGLRLRAGSATIEWSIDDYLDRFVARLNAHLPKLATGDEADEDGEASRNAPTRVRKRKSSEAVHD
jgi:F-type H+-transporting ATPase subunit b